MKKLLLIACLVLPVLSLQAKGIQDDFRRADEKARVSYAFGMIIGSNLSTMGLDFDYEAFAEGIKAMVENGEGQFSEMEAIEIVETALQKAMEKNNEESRRREEEFLARNRERPGVQVTSSGLQYEIIEDAQGERPIANSIVRVNYVGTFVDGTPFDSSNDEEGGAFIPLEMVIPGWTEGLMLMSPGSKYRFFIPSHLAYGREGVQSIIPPHSTLIFLVELLEIADTESDEK